MLKEAVIFNSNLVNFFNIFGISMKKKTRVLSLTGKELEQDGITFDDK